jgi:hypothetical protein
VKESSQRLEKSSQRIEGPLAVLPVLSHDGFAFKSVLEELLHVVFPSKPVLSGSRDGRFESKAWSKLSRGARESFLARMKESFERLFCARACQFQMKSSLWWLLQPLWWLLQALWWLLHVVRWRLYVVRWLHHVLWWLLHVVGWLLHVPWRLLQALGWLLHLVGWRLELVRWLLAVVSRLLDAMGWLVDVLSKLLEDGRWPRQAVSAVLEDGWELVEARPSVGLVRGRALMHASRSLPPQKFPLERW